MKIGFVGLGNVGGKLAGSLLRNNVDLYVRDLNADLVEKFTDIGAKTCINNRVLMETCDAVITCLPSPAASASVMEDKDGLLEGMNFDQIISLLNSTKINVIASGGVTSLGDLKRLKDLRKENLEGVISGKAIYEGKFLIQDAIELLA